MSAPLPALPPSPSARLPRAGAAPPPPSLSRASARHVGRAPRARARASATALTLALMSALFPVATTGSCGFDPASLDTGCHLMKLAGTCMAPCHSSDGTCTPLLRDTIATWASTLCSVAGSRSACLFPCTVEDPGESLLGGDGSSSSSSSPPPPPGVGGGSSSSSSPPPPPPGVGGGSSSSSPPPPAAFVCRLQQSTPSVFAPYYADLCPSLGPIECSPSPGGTTYCCCTAAAGCGDVC